MGLNQAMDISVSAINANRIHLEVIASNMANINSTRSVRSGPYRRRIPVFGEVPLTFAETLRRAEVRQGGVAVVDMVEDPTPGQRVYNPGHPDADRDGFVTLPNVSLSQEMVDLTYASKLYEANVTVFNTSKRMAQETLQIQ